MKRKRSSASSLSAAVKKLKDRTLTKIIHKLKTQTIKKEPITINPTKEPSILVEPIFIIRNEEGEEIACSAFLYRGLDGGRWIHENDVALRKREALEVKIIVGEKRVQVVERLVDGVSWIGRGEIGSEGWVKVGLRGVRVVWSLGENMTGFWTGALEESDEGVRRTLELMGERGWCDHFEVVFGIVGE